MWECFYIINQNTQKLGRIYLNIHRRRLKHTRFNRTVSAYKNKHLRSNNQK